MRASILLFFSITGVLLQPSMEADEEANALRKANTILEKMDNALRTKDLNEFLDMHMDDFEFHFCNVDGKSVNDLKKVLESDPHMSQAIASKHSIISSTGSSGLTKVNPNTWQFLYEEHLLLKDDQAYRTEGSIQFVDLGTHVKIVSAEEHCPEAVF